MGVGDIKFIVLGILGFTLVIFTLSSILVGMVAENPTMADPQQYNAFNSTYNKYTDLDNSINGLNNKIQTVNSNPSTFGVLNSLILTVWETLRFVPSIIFVYFFSIITSVSSTFPIPAFVGGLAILAILVIFIFAVWDAIFRGS